MTRTHPSSRLFLGAALLSGMTALAGACTTAGGVQGEGTPVAAVVTTPSPEAAAGESYPGPSSTLVAETATATPDVTATDEPVSDVASELGGTVYWWSAPEPRADVSTLGSEDSLMAFDPT